MEIFTINLDGTNQKQITNLGRCNWTPYYLTDNQHIIFSSNFNSTADGKYWGVFNLYLIRDDGSGLKRVIFKKSNVLKIFKI